MSSYEDRIEDAVRALGEHPSFSLCKKKKVKREVVSLLVAAFVGDKPLYEIDRNKPEVDDGEFLVEDPDTIGDGWYGVLIQVVPEDE